MNHKLFGTFVLLATLLFSPMGAFSAPANAPKASAPSPQAIALAKNQVAVQLGAMKLGLVKPGQSAQNLTPAQLQAALSAGTQAMTGGNLPAAQLQQATLAALQSPISAPALGLDPAKISPAAIVAASTQINPAVATPAIAKAAVTASMAFTGDSKGINHPVFGPQPDTSSLPAGAGKEAIQALNAQTKSAQIQSAATAEGTVLTAALQNINPNIKPGTTVQLAASDPNYSKIQSAIAAISSASISGLGNFNVGSTSDLIYGKTAPNIQALTISLVSTSQGLVSLANTANGANPVLTAVAQGASQAAPTVTSAISSGIAQGAYSSYAAAATAAGQTPTSPTQFASQNSGQIATSLNNAGIPATPASVTAGITAPTTNNGNQNGQGQNGQGNTGNTGNTGNSSSGTPGGGFGGVPGLGTFGLSPGGSSPVTNTQGR